MATKNAVAKAWTILPSGDGLLWSAFPAGDKPGLAPFILLTDIVAGPTAGNVTGGGEEGSNGCYLGITLLNPGVFSSYGVTNHVTIGGVNVANYRALATPQNPKLAALGAKVLFCQVGALGTPTNGTPLPISVTVAGTGPSNATSSSFYVALNGANLSFTPQPGPMVYIDPVNGNNANSGSFASPKKDLQDSTGQVGAVKIITTANGTNGTVPGTHFILMPTGTYSTTGVNSRVVDLFRVTGLAPSGAANRGPVVFNSYPGAAGSNSFTAAYVLAPSGAGGCFNGNDSTRAYESSTAYGGFTGYCQHIVICNLRLEGNAASGGDKGPINTQNRGQNWRIVNNDLSWQSTVTGTANQARSAGIEGSPNNSVIFGNYIHDIKGTLDVADEADTNHGMYFDGFGSGGTGEVAHDNWIAFNYIYNITAGNGIQFYDGVNGAGMANNVVVYNWIKLVHKHGINVSNATKSGTIFNNIIEDSGEDGIRFQTSSAVGTPAIVAMHNVVYGWGRTTTNRYAFNHSSTGSGTIKVESNIAMQKAGMTAGYGFFARNSTEITPAGNRWFDATGVLAAKPSEDATGTVGDPGLTNPAAGDFTLANGSACINAAATPAVTRAYGLGLKTAPQGASHDIGAYERS